MPADIAKPRGEDPARKLKVLRIISRLNVGGPARQACFLHERLSKEWETVLVTGRLDKGEADMAYLLSSMEGVHWIEEMSRPLSLWSDCLALFYMWKLIRKEKPDIVHTHTAKAGMLGRVAAILARVPVRIHTFHGNVFSGYFSAAMTRLFILLERSLARFTTTIVTVSNLQATQLVETFRIAPRSKVTVVRNGFDFTGFNDMQKGARFRNSFGIADDELLIVWLGRFVPVKNLDLLVETITLSRSSAKLRFMVIGDGPERYKLERCATECTHLTVLPPVRDVAEVWCASDVALLTSTNEGTPTVLLEAMAAGKPFIATEVGGVADLAVPPIERARGWKRAQNGFLVRDGAQAIVRCLALLERDRSGARAMGEIGRQFVSTHHSCEGLAHEIDQLYRMSARALRFDVRAER